MIIHPVRGNKYPQAKIHDTTLIYDGSQANSGMLLFRGRPLHYVDTIRTTIGGDKLEHIVLLTADTYCCVMTSS
jgi:hypothetical protein